MAKRAEKTEGNPESVPKETGLKLFEYMLRAHLFEERVLTIENVAGRRLFLLAKIENEEL